MWHASDADTPVLVERVIVRLLRGCSRASLGLRSRLQPAAEYLCLESSLGQGRLKHRGSIPVWFQNGECLESAFCGRREFTDLTR